MQELPFNIRQTALSIVALIKGGIMISRITGDTTSMNDVLSTVKLSISK